MRPFAVRAPLLLLIALSFKEWSIDHGLEGSFRAALDVGNRLTHRDFRCRHRQLFQRLFRRLPLQGAVLIPARQSFQRPFSY